MKHLIAAALVASAFATGAQAQITGTYTVAGTCPGQNGAYSGVLTITRPDSLYSLRWVLGSGQVSTARAIEQDGYLAIAYELDGSGGVMITRQSGGGWQGRWATFGARTRCVENWRRR